MTRDDAFGERFLQAFQRPFFRKCPERRRGIKRARTRRPNGVTTGAILFRESAAGFDIHLIGDCARGGQTNRAGNKDRADQTS